MNILFDSDRNSHVKERLAWTAFDLLVSGKGH